MAYTFDDNTVSDLHKDAFGYRPGESFWSEWDRCDDDGKQRLWDHLIECLKSSIEEDRYAEEVAIKRFESLVAKTLASGASDRSTALKWIMDASDANGDWQFLCFYHGLPYNYFSKA